MFILRFLVNVILAFCLVAAMLAVVAFARINPHEIVDANPLWAAFALSLVVVFGLALQSK